MRKFLDKKSRSLFYMSLTLITVALFSVFWFLNHSFILIRVSPRNAIVTIDNAPVRVSRTGQSRKTLAPGPHTVRIEADGYIGRLEKVDLHRSRQKKINISLKEIPKPLSVSEKGRFLARDGDFNTVIYLGDDNTTLYKAKVILNEAGEPSIKNLIRMTDPKLSDIEEIIWSPDFELALFRKKDGVYLFDFKKYDFVNQTETLWGKDIGSVAWSPDNSKIAHYYAPPSGERSLIFSNLANTEQTRVADLGALAIENPILRWSPDSEWLIVVPRHPSNFAGNKIYLFNSYSRELKEITEVGSQIGAIFSPDNNSLLYASYSKDPYNPVRSLLSISDKEGKNARSLDLRAELKKIAWRKDSKDLIVASFNEEKKRESIFSYNTESKEKTGFSITALDSGYINSLLLSDDEKLLFYENSEGIFALKVE